MKAGVMTRAFALGRAAPQPDPFAHVAIDHCLEDVDAAALLAWFEDAAPWRLVETDFYEQYEFSLLHVALPTAAIARLFSRVALDDLCAQIETTFATPLTRRVDAVAHKLLPGQRIAIHNDFLEEGETHRLTIQLNRGLRDDDGGYFMLFNSFDAADVHSIYAPVSGNAIAFAIGPGSHHAVSKMHGGERYTIVFSFYAERG
jgi:hypothetical protein